MKSKIISIFSTLIITLFLTVSTVYASDPPLPPGESGTGNSIPIGGNAPVSGGLFILVALAAGYGGIKLIGQGEKRIQE